MVKRWAIVRNGIVENVCLWDGVTPWQPPEGTRAIECHDEVSKDWVCNEGGSFSAPVPG